MSVRQAGVLGPNPSLHPTDELKRSVDESEFMIESLYSNARLYDLMYPKRSMWGRARMTDFDADRISSVKNDLSVARQ